MRIGYRPPTDGEQRPVAVVRWSKRTTSDLRSLVGIALLLGVFAASLTMVFSARAGVVRDVAVVVAYVTGAGVLLLGVGGIFALTIMLVLRGDGVSRRLPPRAGTVAAPRRPPRMDRRGEP